MGKSGKVIVAIIVVAIIAGGGWLLMGNKPDKSTSTSSTANQDSQTNEAVAATITYTDSGFSLSSNTVMSGAKVRIVNNSKKEIKLASNPHPVHTDNPELNVGDIEAGDSKTFTLTTKGMWGFHNHYVPTNGGTITVE